MKMTGETKFFIGIIVATLAIIAGAAIILSRPAPTIDASRLIPEGSVSLGNPESDVTLVEFSDLQCPACRSFHPTVSAILEQYGNDIHYVYRHFPLDQHPMAVPAAIAAEAAHRQEKFYEMVDYIFENQEDLSDELLDQAAVELELDIEQYNADREDPAIADKVQEDLVDGSAAGVNSTPSFFLNGMKLNLFNHQELINAVEEALAESSL